MEYIKSTTALHNFPDIYNSNIQEIDNRLISISKEITEIKKDIDSIKDNLNYISTNYDTNIESLIDKKITNNSELIGNIAEILSEKTDIIKVVAEVLKENTSFKDTVDISVKKYLDTKENK